MTQVTTVDVDTFVDDRVERTVNTLMPRMEGAWVYVGFNAEYLFFPFSSSRSVAELLAFHPEERRGVLPYGKGIEMQFNIVKTNRGFSLV